jgi:hypothetical protein
MGLLVSGKNPAALKTAERSYFTATAGQTTFTVSGGYSPGDIDVFMNGIRLIESDDYFATNGSTVVLTAAANAGDSIVVVCYYQFQATGHWTKAESDARYLTAAGTTPLTSFLRTPNYGVSSTGDNLSAELTAAPIGQQGVGVKAYGRSMSTFGGDLHHIADTRGAGGSQKFYGWNGTSLSTFMNIDSSGRVTKPNQPRFFARSNYASNAGPSGVYVFGTVDLNIGGGYNSSNGRFTAPIGGTYHIFASALSRNSATLNSYLRINGSTALVYSEDSRSGSFGDVHPKIVYNLNAGDYIEFFCSNATYGGAYDYFGGWLVA